MGSWNPDTRPGTPLQRQVQSAYLCSVRLQAAGSRQRQHPLPKCLFGACCMHSEVLDPTLLSSLLLCRDNRPLRMAVEIQETIHPQG